MYERECLDSRPRPLASLRWMSHMDHFMSVGRNDGEAKRGRSRPLGNPAEILHEMTPIELCFDRTR